MATSADGQCRDGQIADSGHPSEDHHDHSHDQQRCQSHQTGSPRHSLGWCGAKTLERGHRHDLFERQDRSGEGGDDGDGETHCGELRVEPDLRGGDSANHRGHRETDAGQGQPGAEEACRNTDDATDDTNPERLDKHHRRDLSPRSSHGAKQRDHEAALDHRCRQGRGDEHPGDEERDRRERDEVEAQRGQHLLGESPPLAGRRDGQIGGEECRRSRLKILDINSVAGDELDAIEPADPAEQLLSGGDIHHHDPLPDSGEAVGLEERSDLDGPRPAADRDRQLVTRFDPDLGGQRAGNQGPEAEESRIEIREGVVAGEHRTDLGIEQEVDPEQSNTIAELHQQDRVLDDGDEQRFGGQGPQGCQGCVGQAAGAGDLESRHAGDLVDAFGKRGDGGSAGGDGGDHGGHSGGDADDRDQEAPRPAEQRSQQQRAEDHGRTTIDLNPPTDRRRAHRSDRRQPRLWHREWRGAARRPRSAGARRAVR